MDMAQNFFLYTSIAARLLGLLVLILSSLLMGTWIRNALSAPNRLRKFRAGSSYQEIRAQLWADVYAGVLDETRDVEESSGVADDSLSRLDQRFRDLIDIAHRPL